MPKESKVWLVTGCSRGLGRAIAEALLAAGERLVATARSVEDLAFLDASDRLHKVALDVTDADAARDAVEVADALAGRIAPVPIRYVDERFTTLTAQRALREAGVRARGQRAVIDQAAAVGILQNWLDQRRAALSPHGEVGDG